MGLVSAASPRLQRALHVGQQGVEQPAHGEAQDGVTLGILRLETSKSLLAMKKHVGTPSSNHTEFSCIHPSIQRMVQHMLVT